MKRSDIRSLRRFIGTVIAASPRRAAAGAVVLLASSVMEGMGVLLLVPLLDLVGINVGGGALGQVEAGFAKAFAVVGMRPTLPAALAVYVALNALQGYLQRWQTTLDLAVQHEFVRVLRNRVYRAMAEARWVFLARSRSSDALQILTHEINRLRLAASYLSNALVAALLAVVYFAIAMRVSAAMTGVVAACGAILAWLVVSKIDSVRTLGRAWSESSQQLYAAMTEHLASMKTAKSYGIAGRHADIFDRLSANERDVQLQTTQTVAGLRQRLALGVPIVLAAVVYVSYGVLAVPTAQLLLLLLMFGRLIPRLTGLFENVQELAVTLPAFDAVHAFEQRCLQAREPVVAAHEPISLIDRIAFDRVTFDYREDGTTVAVRDVTLQILAGQTTAIVGQSGAGKSTLVDLLTGLLAPTKGRILVDGCLLRPEHLKSWRDQIGYVAQETFLFHDSVRANLLWARPDAGEDDLWSALESAAATDFVRALPEGLDTIVGDRGVLVSGGERQRISLARALLRRPALLILDEATSSLDSENESRIQEAIDDLHQRITIVIITHRLSTVRHADSIHVLDRNTVVESGTWAELSTREHGRFHELCRAQGLDDLPQASLQIADLSDPAVVVPRR